MNVKNQKSLFFLNLLFLFGLVGCLRRSSQFVDVANPNSALLSLLMQETDFPSGWQISGVGTTQKNNVDVSSPYEEVSRHIAGSLGDDVEYVRFIHIVRQYETSTPPFNEIDGIQGAPPSLSQDFSLHIDNSYGHVMVSSCYSSLQNESPNFYDCQISVKYESIISSLTIYGVGMMEQSSLEQTVNQLLENIDQRIITKE